MFNLLPKDTVFFDLFEGLGKLGVEAAMRLKELAQHFPDIVNDVSRIRQSEHAADELAHSALDRLDRTFITPFDREDIHTLVNELDNIIDNVDALAKRFTLYHVEAMDPPFLKQCDVLIAATTVLNEAVKLLRKTRKLSDLSTKLIEVHRLESAGDDIHHAAISDLYSGAHEPLHVMKWKELYDYVEEAIDGCEDVTNTIERIVLKNG
jgi:predicted phosphate transport protein (TIGR00153 family)